MIEGLLYGLLLSLIAGSCTAIGGLVALVLRKPISSNFISIIMGFSAGVMIYISFVELLQEGIQSFGLVIGSLFMLLGMVIMYIIDISISQKYSFEESVHEQKCDVINHRLEKTSFLVILGVFIHNFPEGMATIAGSLKDLQLGTLLAFAIALHNIPEGIIIAVPVYLSTNNKKKAIYWSLISGMSEPVGALIFGAIFFSFITDLLLGALLAVVGGIMIYISIDELLPVCHLWGNEHISIVGIAGGFLVMALSLAVL